MLPEMQGKRVLDAGCGPGVYAGWLAVLVPSYRRPMQAVINPLIRAVFTLERILEPLPTQEFRLKEPEEYAELSRTPGFMFVRAVKGV